MPIFLSLSNSIPYNHISGVFCFNLQTKLPQLLNEEAEAGNVYSPLNSSTLENVSEVTLETKLLFVTLQYMLYSNRNTKTASTLPASFASAYEAVWPQLLS